jgi:FixJ family two-component response regulator
VDDDAAFLTATSRLLQANGFAVKTFKSAREFLLQLSQVSHGCVLVDLRMPELNGLELQEAMAKTEYAMPIVFLTAQGDIPTTVHAMKNGAVDFLEKVTSQKNILAAIDRALKRSTHDLEKKARVQKARDFFDQLSLRQREVLGHILKGKLNKQIAYDLGISERTVKAHRTAVTTKLRTHAIAEMARLVQEAELPPDDLLHCPPSRN